MYEPRLNGNYSCLKQAATLLQLSTVIDRSESVWLSTIPTANQECDHQGTYMLIKAAHSDTVRLRILRTYWIILTELDFLFQPVIVRLRKPTAIGTATCGENNVATDQPNGAV